MAKDTRIQFRIDSELKNRALSMGLNMSAISRNAILAVVNNESKKTNKEN